MTTGKSAARTSVARGAVLTVAMRWTDRLLGIVSTLILARLLMPADFGIVAMASLVVVLIDTLLDLGVNAALVQNRNADRDDFDTAWTLRLAQSALAAAIIGVFGAPVAAGYFNDVRVEPVLQLMAVAVLVGGFENIGVVGFQKEMEFGREFRFFFLRRVAGFLVTLVLALALRSYWAMVIGSLAGRLVGVGLSYALHDFRPRLSLRRLASLWSFSQWMLLRNLGTYGAQQIDKLLVGRRAGASVLGAYHLADDIAAMPVTELLAPVGRVLFPAFVKVADDPQELRRTFSLAFAIQLLIALPAGIGLALVAGTAVPLLLGPQWLSAVPLLQVLALISVATAIAHSSGYLLLALGKVRLQAIFVWCQFLLLAALLLLGFPQAGAAIIAEVRLAVAALAVFFFLAMVLHAVPSLRLADLLVSGWRPVAATAVMSAILIQWPPSPSLPLAVAFLAQVGIGATTYAAAVLLLWWLSGCGAGAERYLLDKLHPPQPDSAGTIACTSHPDVDALPAAAMALWQTAASAPLESSPKWFANLQRTVFPHDPDVNYRVAWRQNTATAILPLRQTRHGPVRRIESLTNFYTSLYSPVLAADAGVEDLSAILRSVAADGSPPDEMRFSPMDPDSAAFRHLFAALRDIGWVPYRYFCFGNWYLPVDSDWPTCLGRRPGELRSTIKRMGRKFAAAGGSLEIVDAASGLDDAIAAYVDVYSASWKIPEPYPDFMPGLIRLLAAAGQLRLGVARLDGRPIAAQVWAVQDGRAAIVKLAHREDSATWSAGTLLTASLMERAIAVDRVREVDYLIGDDPYKRNWMTDRRERWGIVAYNPRTALGLALLAREATARALKRLRAAGRA